MRVCPYQNRLSTGGDVIQTKHNIYWDSKLLLPGVCFAKLVKTGLWAIWAEQHALCTVHLIFIYASQEGIKCTKAKE